MSFHADPLGEDTKRTKGRFQIKKVDIGTRDVIIDKPGFVTVRFFSKKFFSRIVFLNIRFFPFFSKFNLQVIRFLAVNKIFSEFDIPNWNMVNLKKHILSIKE